MIPARLFLLGVAVVLASVVNAAPITYKLAPSTNFTGAHLDYGYLTTDGALGADIALILGGSLLDYEFKMTEGLTSLTLTPANSRIVANDLTFDITAESIAVAARPRSNSTLGKIIFRDLFSTGNLDITRLSAFGGDFGGITASLDTVSHNLLLRLPFVVATVIPEPTALALAAILAGCGMMRRRRY